MFEWLLTTVSAENLAVFRMVFAVSLLLKFGLEWWRGYLRYMQPQGYLWYSDWSQDKRSSLPMRIYRSLFYVKMAAAVALFWGAGQPWVCLILVAALGSELRLYFKYHANLMFLLVLLFALVPQAGWVSPLDLASAGSIERVYYAFFCLTISSVYLFTAIHKINPRFLSGDVVAQTLRLLGLHNRLHFDNFIGRFAQVILAHQRVLGYLMVLTVVLEVLLPALLLSKTTFVFGCLLGIALHIGFTVLFPATLLHFSVMMVGSYLLFAKLQILP